MVVRATWSALAYLMNSNLSFSAPLVSKVIIVSPSRRLARQHDAAQALPGAQGVEALVDLLERLAGGHERPQGHPAAADELDHFRVVRRAAAQAPHHLQLVEHHFRERQGDRHRAAPYYPQKRSPPPPARRTSFSRTAG